MEIELHPAVSLQALKQTSREATILLYAPTLDPHLQIMTNLADKICEGQPRGRTKANLRTQKS